MIKISLSQEDMEDFKKWFANYVHTFQYDDMELQQNIDLKEEHTKRVCQEIIMIGEQLGLHENELRLLEIIALFHDIGRFEQYDRYRTFMDRKSVDHAALGIKILQEHGVLKQLDDPIQELILCSIRYHNRSFLPQDLKDECLFFCRMVRDADKLDIWKVVTDYYCRKDEKRNKSLELDLPDSPGFSQEVGQALLNRRIVDLHHVKNLNDFKLLQVGWIFDINFQPTFDCIKKRRYLEMIRDVLPKSKEINEIFDCIDAWKGPGWHSIGTR